MRKSSLILLVLFGLTAISSTAIGTLSWFVSKPFNQIDIEGKTAAAYFAYGNGQSAGTAYGIKTPRQLYNLAWLQYNGNFNKDTNGDHVIDRQYYFELANDIDMTGWTLPPIGTDDNPFLGTFDGKSHTISGLTVSNKSNLTKPNAITYNKQPEIVGLFGVVGDGVKDIDYTYNSSINTIKNTTIKNITAMDKKVQVQISGGCAHFIAEDVDVFTKFFKAADNLLYQAKRNGKNNIVYLSKN